jgi:hypothetical protein
VQTSLQKIPPTSSLESRKIEFTLARFEAANVYILKVIKNIIWCKTAKILAFLI